MLSTCDLIRFKSILNNACYTYLTSGSGRGDNGLHLLRSCVSETVRCKSHAMRIADGGVVLKKANGP
jgi:hypothetical protein